MMVFMRSCCKLLEVLSVLKCILGEEVGKIEEIQVPIAGRS
jgi:hypothetical protein